MPTAPLLRVRRHVAPAAKTIAYYATGAILIAAALLLVVAAYQSVTDVPA